MMTDTKPWRVRPLTFEEMSESQRAALRPFSAGQT